MAAKKAAAKKAAAPKKEAKKEAVEKLPIGVDYLAEKHDISASAVRVRLRDYNIPKAGKSYGWKTKGEADSAWSKCTKEAA